MQDKFKISEIFNNGAYKICESSYKSVRALRVGVSDVHGKQDFVWKCPCGRCHKRNERAYDRYHEYVAWVDDCGGCGNRFLIIKTNQKERRT